MNQSILVVLLLIQLSYTALLYPCISFCLKWDESLVDDPNSDLLMVQLPEITCPSWTFPVDWQVHDENDLNSQHCECHLSSHQETTGSPIEDVQHCIMCSPLVTSTNAHQICVDSIRGVVLSQSSSSSTRNPASVSSQSLISSTSRSLSFSSPSSSSTASQPSISVPVSLSSSSASVRTACPTPFPEPELSAKTHSNIPQALYDKLKEVSDLLYNTYHTDDMKGEFDIEGKQFKVEEIFDATLLNGAKGYIATDDSPNNSRIIVGIKGTTPTSPTDLGTDLNIGGLEALWDYLTHHDRELTMLSDTLGLDACLECRLHPGFFKEAKTLLDHATPIIVNLIKKYPCHKVYVIGHSMGGSVAEIMGAAWRNSLLADVSVISFAAPRAGNRKWSSFVNALFSDTKSFARLTHTGDIVPHLPLREMVYTEFDHPEIEYFIPQEILMPTQIETCTGDEDESCSDSEEFHLYQKMSFILMSSVTSWAISDVLGPAGTLVVGNGVKWMFSGFTSAHANYITYIGSSMK
ncbi:Alpha/Beta hydrolase protein [Hyaloscypha sp. PMI_1271]|nr:Alpha/Beta hydrolase protein [Hyaloscypha sp. PMI_1271]